MAIDYNCLDRKRPDVVSYYVHVGSWPLDPPRIFNDWFYGNGSTTGGVGNGGYPPDVASRYSTLDEYAAALGCPPTGVQGPPPGPGPGPAPSPGPPPPGYQPQFSFTEILSRWFRHDPVPAIAIGLAGIILANQWLNKDR